MAAETFGHEPVVMDLGSCGMGGCQCPGHYDEEVCARCVTVHYETYTALFIDEQGNEIRKRGRWPIERNPVLWPCTSAVVLGLVPREEPRS